MLLGDLFIVNGTNKNGSFDIRISSVVFLSNCDCQSTNVTLQFSKMSFIPVTPESHFPIQNLPFGVFSTADNVSCVDMPRYCN